MKKKKPITRTDKITPESVFGTALMAQALTGDASNVILAQEATGQRELVASNQLPADGLLKTEFCLALKACGGKVHGPTNGDPMFVDVDLPPGWVLRATDHSMHTELIDEKGRKRAGIFYKAAFYDRSAHIYPVRRLNAEKACADRSTDPQVFFACIKAGDKTVWRGPDVTDWTREKRNRLYAESRARGIGELSEAEPTDGLQTLANKVLTDAFPDHGSILAYWDLTDEQIIAKLPSKP